MKSHGKSWNLKIHLIPGLEKSWILGKMVEVMEKSRNFIYWFKYFVLFENLVIEQMFAPKRLGFQHLLIIEPGTTEQGGEGGGGTCPPIFLRF